MKVNGQWVGWMNHADGVEKSILARCKRDPSRVVVAVALALSLAAAMGSFGPWFLLGLVLLIGYREISPRRAERRERARLLDDCHRQHTALLRGGWDDTLAYFGRFEPAALDGSYAWCAPREAYPKTSRVQSLVKESPVAVDDRRRDGIAHEIDVLKARYIELDDEGYDQPLDDMIRNFT